MSDVRTVPAMEPRPIIPPLAGFYSHARDILWVVFRLTAGGMLLVHGIMKVMPMVEKGVVPTIEAFPALVTKNVMFGACGSGGAACCAGCCCASTPDVTPTDASANAAKMNVFRLFIAAFSLGFVLNDSVNGRGFLDRPEAKWVGRQTHQWRPTARYHNGPRQHTS
jgi:hypothetical protein